MALTGWPESRNIDYVRGTAAMIEAKMTRIIGMTRMEPVELQEETQVHFPAPQDGVNLTLRCTTTPPQRV
jgi:hypothetical protein